MNGIVVYAGKGSCRERLLRGIQQMKSRGNELAGLAVQKGSGFAHIHCKGTPAELSEKAGAEQGAGLGLAACAAAVRCSASRLTAPPAVNGRYAVALDRGIENFEALRQWCRPAVPIVSDEELFLTLLCTVQGEDTVEVIRRLLPSFQKELGFAVADAQEEAIYARAGKMPLYLGITDDGWLLANEAYPVLTACRRYCLLQSGETVKIGRERVSVFDARQRRIKKQFRPSPVLPQRGTPQGDALFYLSSSAKATLSGIVVNAAIDFSGLRLTRRMLEHFSRVVITGSGAAYHAAQLAAVQLEAFADLPCSVLPAGELSRAGIFYSPDMLLLAVSDSGEEEAVFDCLRRAEEFGAKTLLFTQQPYALCGRAADMVMDFGGFEGGACAFLSCTLALCLFAVWAGHKSGVVSELYSSVAAKLAELLPGKLAAAVKSSPAAETAAALLLSAEQLYLTGGGADAAMAAEGARYLRAALGREVQAIPLSEFMSEVQDGLSHATVISLVSRREHLMQTLAELRRLKANRAKVLVITTANLEETFDGFDGILSVTESLPVFDCLTCLAALYGTAEAAVEQQKNDAEKQAG